MQEFRINLKIKKARLGLLKWKNNKNKWHPLKEIIALFYPAVNRKKTLSCKLTETGKKCYNYITLFFILDTGHIFIEYGFLF